MPIISLGKGAVKTIQAAVSRLFDRARARFLGPAAVKGKSIVFSYQHDLSLPGLFEAANREEHTVPNQDTLESLVRVADGYLESQKIQAQTQVVHAVDAFLREAQAKGVKTDIETVLGGALTGVWKNVTANVRRIVDSESTKTRNIGALEGIIKINAALGEDDPVMAFVVVRDNLLCKSCRRLHVLEDGVTPRVWRLSEIGHQYGKADDLQPTMVRHPHCRCGLISVPRGYGFTADGKIAYVSPDHNEFERQRGLEKSESLFKSESPKMTAAEYLEDLRFYVDRRDDLEIKVIGKVEYGQKRYEVVRIQSKDIGPEDKVLLIRAGIHGEEISGPLTFLSQLDSIADLAAEYGVALIVYPLANPSGWETGKRFNADDDPADAGDDFVRYFVGGKWVEDEDAAEDAGWGLTEEVDPDAKRNQETLVLTADLKNLPVDQIIAAVDIHQDHIHGDQKPAAYHYVLGDHTQYHDIVEKIKGILPVLADVGVDSGFDKPKSTDKDGFIIRHDGSWIDYLYRAGVEHCVVPETTGGTSQAIAEEVNLLWIEGLLDLPVDGALDKSEPLNKAELKFGTELAPLLRAYGWEKSGEGGSHELWHNNRLGPTRPLAIKRDHAGGSRRVSGSMVKKYAADAGLYWDDKRRGLFPDPAHPYAEKYQAAGMLAPDKPQTITWTPSVPHEHVEIGKLVSTKNSEPWLVNKYKAVMVSGKDAGKIPPIKVVNLGDGKLYIDSGEEQYQVAKEMGYTHVPVQKG